MRNKKGFTLIELLAVIVILAIIALIATPIILGIIEDARKGSAESSANGYIDAVEYYAARLQLKEEVLESRTYDVDELDVDMDGEKPTYGSVTIEKGKVVGADICVGGYNIVYENGKMKAKDACGKDERVAFSPKIGDYVKMTPTLASFTTDPAKTGYTEAQTLDPKELNLWVVRKINDDGTIEMISKYISTIDVYFNGKTGYKNFIGYLNEIASAYENKKYTIGSKHIGYNTQTEYLTDTANTLDSTSTIAPWAGSTWESEANTVESQGGGDGVTESELGVFEATTPSGTYETYWVSSRYYMSSNSDRWQYGVIYLNVSGATGSFILYECENGCRDVAHSSAIRPIVVLRPNIKILQAAEGTKEDPFILE